MFQNQLINAVVQWDWQQKMAEEKQKNLRGEPLTITGAAAPTPPKEHTTAIRPAMPRRQPKQPAYVGCTPNPSTSCR